MTSSPDFWAGIDGVLVVNLDARPDRWASTQALLAGVVPADKLHRLPATAGVALPGYAAPPWFRGRRRDKTWAGRAGCALSHRAAVEHASAQGWRTLLVLEDDLDLSPDFDAVLASLSDALQRTDWDVCYLGHTDPQPPYRHQAALAESHALFKVAGASTTHAYLLRDSTYAMLLKRLPRTEGIWDWIATHRAIDRWYYRNLARWFRVCAVSPAIINQETGYSDITQRAHERTYATRIDHPGHGALAFAVLGAWRWLSFRLAEPRDIVRGQIKRLRGF